MPTRQKTLYQMAYFLLSNTMGRKKQCGHGRDKGDADDMDDG